MVVGCTPGTTGSEECHSSIRRATLPFFRSNSATAESFHKLTPALVAALLATTVYGYAVGTYLLTLTSKVFRIFPELTSSSTTLSERLFATSIRSPLAERNTAKPAGYGDEVDAGILAA